MYNLSMDNMESQQAPNTLNPAQEQSTSGLRIVIAIFILIFAIGFGVVYYGYKGIFYSASESEIKRAEQDILTQLNETYDSNFTLTYSHSGYSGSGDNLHLYADKVYFTFQGKSSLENINFKVTCIRPTKDKEEQCKLDANKDDYKSKIVSLLRDRINSKKSGIETRLGATGIANQFANTSINDSFATIIDFRGVDIQDIENQQAFFELNDIIEDIETRNDDLINEYRKTEPGYFVAVALRFNTYDIVVANQKVFIRRNFSSEPVQVFTPADIQSYIDTDSK